LEADEHTIVIEKSAVKKKEEAEKVKIPFQTVKTAKIEVVFNQK